MEQKRIESGRGVPGAWNAKRSQITENGNGACNQEAVQRANVSYEDYFIKMAMCLHM